MRSEAVLRPKGHKENPELASSKEEKAFDPSHREEEVGPIFGKLFMTCLKL
jgi:hypothetical protein